MNEQQQQKNLVALWWFAGIIVLFSAFSYMDIEIPQKGENVALSSIVWFVCTFFAGILGYNILMMFTYLLYLLYADQTQKIIRTPILVAVIDFLLIFTANGVLFGMCVRHVVCPFPLFVIPLPFVIVLLKERDSFRINKEVLLRFPGVKVLSGYGVTQPVEDVSPNTKDIL